MSWQIAPDVSWVADSEQGIIYAMAMPQWRPTLLDARAGFLWQEVAAGTDPLAAATDHFTGDPETIRAGVRATMAELVELGLLQEVPDEA